jgi:ABC-2 type transport system permease protein
MLDLFLIELRRTFALTIRYPANFVSSMVIGTLSFYGLFMGAQYLSGQEAFGTNLDAMVVSWSAWVLATKGLNKPAVSVQTEADTGVLESVFLSRHPTWLTFLVRALTESVIDIVFIVVMVATLVWLTGSSVAFPPTIALPVVLLMLAAIGFGLTVASLALQVKRIGSALPMLQLLILFLMFTPFETWTSGMKSGLSAIAMWLPMVPSVIMLRQEMAFGGTFDPILAVQALLNGIGWAAFGVLAFAAISRRVRTKGLLAGY